MSYDNFKQKVWAKGIQKELERLHVFAADTNQEYTGVIKNLGDTVRIKQIGKPTISTVQFDAKDNRYITLSSPETVPDSSLSVVVDRQSTFNYCVPDIDEAQGATGVMEALNSETSEGLADEHDKFISNLVLTDPAVKRYDNSGNAWVFTKDNAFTLFDACQQILWENDVKPSTEIVITLPPWAIMALRQGFIKVDTDNSAMLKNGEVTRYGNMIIKMSNNVAVDGSGKYHVQVKTRRAIGFVHQATHLEPYRPEQGFSDAIKGFDLFGGRIVRPKEIVDLMIAPN